MQPSWGPLPPFCRQTAEQKDLPRQFQILLIRWEHFHAITYYLIKYQKHLGALSHYLLFDSISEALDLLLGQQYPQLGNYKQVSQTPVLDILVETVMKDQNVKHREGQALL